MTDLELAALRQKLGLTQTEFGRALGLLGKPQSIKVQVSQWERGIRRVPPHRALIASMINRHGLSKRRKAEKAPT